MPNSRLLVTCHKDHEFIHIYKAQIPSNLLRSLENPSTATTKSSLITIEHIQVPSCPFETLQRRILAELLITDVSPCDSELTDPTFSDMPNENDKRPCLQEDDEIFERHQI